MSRIHDALKKAEQEKAASGNLKDGAAKSRAYSFGHTGDDGVLPRAGEGLLTPEQHRAEETPEGLALIRELEDRCPARSWQPDPKRLLFVDGQDHALGTEEFRTLRSHLYLIRDRQPLQRLLITSPLPQDGKTFVAANLAQVIARQPERRVLLIDGDLRLSRLHLSLGTPQTPGLSDYLTGEADEFSIIQRGPLDNFFFIPAGKTISNSSELLGHGGLKHLFVRLAPAFDWIILDSPPAIPVSDAKIMADVCDGVIIVIRAGVTPFDLAQKACRDFRKRGLVGVVLNGADSRQGYGYNYYSYYGKTTEESGSGKSKPVNS
jgi:capsular exopolysaccharide synthesis family protein